MLHIFRSVALYIGVAVQNDHHGVYIGCLSLGSPPHRKYKLFYNARCLETAFYNHISYIKIQCFNAIFSFMAQQPLVGQGLLIIEASRSYSDTSHSVGLICTSDQSDAETSTWQHTTLTRDRHPCPQWDFFLPVRGFSPLIHFCTV
jgi:hypothetical protein